MSPERWSFFGSGDGGSTLFLSIRWKKWNNNVPSDQCKVETHFAGQG